MPITGVSALYNTDLDWELVAHHANWRVSQLAAHFRISVRTLQRFFHQEMGMSATEWLLVLRQTQALTLLLAGRSVKETASELGYHYAYHFSRDFKSYWACNPGRKDELAGLARTI